MQLSDYTNRTPAEILRDLNAAWERIKILEARLQRERIKRWIVTAALVTLWEVFKLLLLHRWAH